MGNVKKKTEFMELIRGVYNNKNLGLSDTLKKKLLETAKGLESGYKISFLSYSLYPYVVKELQRESLSDSCELLHFMKYLEKKRWKYYFGSIVGVAFSSTFKK